MKALALGAPPSPRPPVRLRASRSAASDGIVHVLRCLLAEADLLMAINGYPTIADLTPDTLMRIR